MNCGAPFFVCVSTYSVLLYGHDHCTHSSPLHRACHYVLKNYWVLQGYTPSLLHREVHSYERMREYTLKVPNNNICDLCLGCLLLILWFYPQPLEYLCSRPAHVDGQNGFDVFLSKITIMSPCFGLVTIQYVLFSFYCWVFCYFWHLIYFCVVIYLFMHGKKYESTSNPINPIHF